jgi:acetolactate synthase small subunit
MENRWVFVIKSKNQPGMLNSATAVFSNRGISVDTILGGGTITNEGRVILSFQASENKQKMLLRVLKRLSTVESVTVYPYNSPELRAISIICLPISSLKNWDNQAIYTETITSNSETQTLMLTGTTLAVEELLQRLKTEGVLLEATLSVIA